MNTQPSSRELKVMEARAKATTRAEMARLLGVHRDYVSRIIREMGLPRFGPRVVHDEDRKNEIIALWRSGKGSREIARELGLTAGQVAGFLDRNKLKREPRLRVEKVRRPRPARVNPLKESHPAFKVFGFASRPAPVIPLNISFLDLERHHCREPYGDGPNFTYCGHPVAYQSYCGAHASINYRPAEARNRDPRPR